MSKDDRFDECNICNHVYDEADERIKTIRRPIADILNELNERIIALESRANDEDTYRLEQSER